jgi:hypothetical protein
MHENLLCTISSQKQGLNETSRRLGYRPVLLRITKRETLNNPTGFMPNLIPLADLEEVTNTMNETDHSQLNNIEEYWPTRISSYTPFYATV